jgi:hypothetical protein
MRASAVGSVIAPLLLAIGACGNCMDDDHLPADPEIAPAGAGGEVAVEPRVARLTGGVGNRVVDSFDQIRAGVRGVQRPIDDCYAASEPEGGWRENLLWDLEVASDGSVTRVTPRRAEYWRGNRIVEALPSPMLGTCMESVLRRLVLPAPIRAGWIRLRFEPV